ncbi:hypothetical protein [Acidovorax lacteus]|uniref:hypothetical protein n=1 Tax=Acidovorax lacteus TaxID=1924988 RepID=UPI0031EC8621
MDFVGKYEDSIKAAALGDFSRLNDFIDRLHEIPRDGEGYDRLLSCIIESHDGASCSLKVTILSVLFKLDGRVASDMARRNLAEAYRDFRNHGSYLHQILFTINRFDGLNLSTSSIEYDRNMRIAYALVNGLNVDEFLASLRC